MSYFSGASFDEHMSCLMQTRIMSIMSVPTHASSSLLKGSSFVALFCKAVMAFPLTDEGCDTLSRSGKQLKVFLSTPSMPVTVDSPAFGVAPRPRRVEW